MKNLESKLQESCVKWFDYSYPKYKHLFFAIPNGGARNIITGAILKRQGVRKGIPDMFLAVFCRSCSGINWGGLFIEFKTDKGKLTAEQEVFFHTSVLQNFKCVVIRDFDSFKELMEKYLP